VERIELEWIGHHYHVVYFWMQLEEVEPLDPRSFHLRVRLDGGDVSERLDVSDVLATAGRRLPKGRLISERTAASAAKNARMLLRGGRIEDHVSSALGLAGGCDVTFVDGAIEPRLPEAVGLDGAKAIMARAGLGDGIAAIAADGSVTFTDEASGAMRDILGYDCPVLAPGEATERVTELRERLSALTAAT
jgi:hypothetical protein